METDEYQRLKKAHETMKQQLHHFEWNGLHVPGGLLSSIKEVEEELCYMELSLQRKKETENS